MPRVKLGGSNGEAEREAVGIHAKGISLGNDFFPLRQKTKKPSSK